VKRLKGETKRVRYLMPDEIQKLLLNCVGDTREGAKSNKDGSLQIGMRM
jgi:hypothetical protein